MGAIVVGSNETHALVGELDGVGMGEDLEAAGIREDRAVPVHEGMQAAELGDGVRTGAHGQVVGVGEHDLGAQVLDRLGGDALDVGLGAHGHEDGGLDIAVRRMQDARARVRLGILGDDLVFEQGLIHMRLLGHPASRALGTPAARVPARNLARGVSPSCAFQQAPIVLSRCALQVMRREMSRNTMRGTTPPTPHPVGRCSHRGWGA